MRHGVKISLSLLLILCIMALCMIPVFAVGTAMTAAEIFGSLWSVYASSVGLSQSFKTAGILNNNSNPYDSGAWEADMTSLFNDYQSYINGNTTLAQFISDKIDDVSVTAAPGVNTVLKMSSDLVEFFDYFSTWVLEYKLNQTRDASGHFNTSGTWYDNTLAYNSASNLYLPTAPSKPTSQYLVTNGKQVTTSGKYAMANANNNAPVLICIVSGSIYAFSSANNSIYWCETLGSTVSNITTSNASPVSGVYYNYRNSGQTAAEGIPTFDNVTDAANFYASYRVGDGSSIQLRPKDKYNETGEGVLDIPDVSDTNYLPKERVEELDVPYDDSLTGVDAITAALEGIKALVLANAEPLTDISPVSPVVPPFVPIEIPSFNFNFSGIWHYVVSWIGSLRSGFAFISSCWAALPYPMIIPIYATAVVVIVIGTYKRFFT